MNTLIGKSVIITGAGSGIGRASAHSIAARGGRVVVADIDAARTEAVAAEIADAGGTALSFRLDVGMDGEFERLSDYVNAKFGGVDVVMNNVGVLTQGRPEYLPLVEWQRVLNINLLSVVRSNLVFLPQLIEQGSGHVVNTASFAGLLSYSIDRLPYAASKAALVQISEGLALYLKPQGIGVTVLCPGPVITDIFSSVRTFGPPVEMRGPDFELLDPSVVGEQVAEAILADTFMLQTHTSVREKLIERASDWDAYVDAQISAAEVSTSIPVSDDHRHNPATSYE